MITALVRLMSCILGLRTRGSPPVPSASACGTSDADGYRLSPSKEGYVKSIVHFGSAVLIFEAESSVDDTHTFDSVNVNFQITSSRMSASGVSASGFEEARASFEKVGYSVCRGVIQKELTDRVTSAVDDVVKSPQVGAAVPCVEKHHHHQEHPLCFPEQCNLIFYCGCEAVPRQTSPSARTHAVYPHNSRFGPTCASGLRPDCVGPSDRAHPAAAGHHSCAQGGDRGRLGCPCSD
eukprot:m.118069 g.118069  ORF g.118069 m.118069 type:complete len:236 (-) comp13221_c0_seq4:2317-3024(-)